MSFTTADLADLDLKSAIDKSPLVVSPDSFVLDVIQQMNQRGDRGTLPEHDHFLCKTKSCAVVIDACRVVGIFTERDLVRLSAKEVDLTDKTMRDAMVSPVQTLNISNVNDVFAILFLFRRFGIRHLPVTDDHEHLVGLISQASLRQMLKPANLLKIRRVAEVMSHNVITARPQDSGLTVVKLMVEHQVSCIVIVEPDNDDRINPIGIITERDLVELQTRTSELSSLSARDVMSSPLILSEPEDSLWQAHQVMKRSQIRRLVVPYNWGKNLGVITQTNLLKAFDPMEMYFIIETLQQTIQQLESEKVALKQQSKSF